MPLYVYPDGPFCSPSTSASSLSALDAPPQYPDPWGPPWTAAAAAPYVQLPLADVETLPIQRPLPLHDAAAAKSATLLYTPVPYPHAVYAPQPALQLQLAIPAPLPMPVPPEVPIVAPTPTHGYNKFDALLGFQPDDLLRQGEQPQQSHGRRKRPLEREAVDAAARSPRSKRARRSPPPSERQAAAGPRREAQPRAHPHPPPRARRTAAPAPAPLPAGPDRAHAYYHHAAPNAMAGLSQSYQAQQRPAR